MSRGILLCLMELDMSFDTSPRHFLTNVLHRSLTNFSNSLTASFTVGSAMSLVSKRCELSSTNRLSHVTDCTEQ